MDLFIYLKTFIYLEIPPTDRPRSQLGMRNTFETNTALKTQIKDLRNNARTSREIKDVRNPDVVAEMCTKKIKI